MITSADIVLWVYATVLSVFVAFVIIVRGQFRRFFALAMCFAVVAAVSLLRLRVLNTYGFNTPEYGYFYYCDLRGEARSATQLQTPPAPVLAVGSIGSVADSPVIKRAPRLNVRYSNPH